MVAPVAGAGHLVQPDAPVALAIELRSWLSVSAALPGRVER
ncbi:hypothetical protein ACWEF6_08680 [Amycolatopsis sp. NPDC004772]